MRFKAIKGDEPIPHIRKYPVGILQIQDWDDYGFRTTCALSLHLNSDHVVALGDVKIIKRGQKPGPTPLPDDWFTMLNEHYCSLGQNFTYYELLASLGRGVFKPLLNGLRDVVFDRHRGAKFENEDVFQHSLLRGSGASLTLKLAPRLFFSDATQPDNLTGALKFSFVNRVSNSSYVIDFDFKGPPELPSRIIALIGYNGSGKTQLLANVAITAHRDTYKPSQQVRSVGEILEADLRFGAVIAVSYSAFDTFNLPGRSKLERLRVEETGELFGYSYCGLRTYLPGQDSTSSEPRGLKNIDDIARDFSQAVKKSTDRQRRPLFRKAMEPLTREPSLLRIGFASALAGKPENIINLFNEMSSGHKIVVNIVAQLVAQLEVRSLVLIDEPESHLHPPLLAALLKSIRIVLEDRDSFAIIATHSPVVLQETPARQVRILRRFQDHTEVALPERETFGENVGTLTREVFDLDSSATDFHDVLDRIIEGHSLEDIDAMFSPGLSSQARAYVVAAMRAGR